MSDRLREEVRAALVQAGRLDGDGWSRKAHAGRCRCGATVLRGLDAHRCGIAVTVDPKALTGNGELAARILGRQTYELHAIAGRIEVDYRDIHRIKARPADHDDNHIVAEHVCGKPPLLTKPRDVLTEKGATPNDDNPPY